jgi:hypothetical protein
MSGANQEDAVKLMIVSRLIGSQNFLLHRNPYDVCLFNFELAHNTPSYREYNRLAAYAQLIMSLCIIVGMKTVVPKKTGKT